MIRITLSLLLILLLQISLSAQENIKGIGLISPPFVIHETDGIMGTDFIKFVELDLYESPNINSGHCLVREQLDSENVLTSIIYSNNKSNMIKHPTSALVWTSYKIHSLQYFQEKNGFVQVQLDDKKYWLKVDELKSYGFQYRSWKTYFHESESANLTSNYNMNLRREPNLNSKKLELLKVNRYNDQFYHLMKMTGKYDGNWAEVEVTMWKSMDDYCRQSKQAPRKIIGWIKYLDDKGFPNIFDIPTPCC